MDLQPVLGGTDFNGSLEVILVSLCIPTWYRCSYGERYQRDGGEMNYQSGFYYCNFFFCCNTCKENLEVVKLSFSFKLNFL